MNEINEAINSFFKLKNEYDTDYYEKYVKPIVNSKKSTKEKKSMYQKLAKPKCVNCKRNVGSLFSIKTNKNFKNRTYSAKCGDITNPCPLDINIFMPLAQPFDKVLGESTQSTGTINVIKTNIIKSKNDLLFNYSYIGNRVVDSFNKLAEELKEETELYDNYLEQYITLTDNPVEINELNTKKVELGIYIQQFKDMIAEFNQSNNQTIMNSAVEFYINTMIPALKEIQTKTYASSLVEYIDNQYVLIQQKNTLQQLNVTYDDPKIVSYVVGMKNSTQTKPKAKPKPKTKKPTFVIEEAVEEPEGSIDFGTDEEPEGSIDFGTDEEPEGSIDFGTDEEKEEKEEEEEEKEEEKEEKEEEKEEEEEEKEEE